LQRLEAERPTRRRHIAEPEILKEESEEEADEAEDMELEEEEEGEQQAAAGPEDEEEVDSEARAAKRLALKQKALQRQEVELFQVGARVVRRLTFNLMRSNEGTAGYRGGTEGL
jgi:hypothetical protein